MYWVGDSFGGHVTKKDYERFASMCQELHAKAATETGSLVRLALVEESLADVLAADNPAGFKRDLFLKVCRQIRQRQL